MIDTFSLNLLLAFLVGSFWITISTVIAEKFGSKIGGFVAGLPASILVSLFFIGLNQSPQIAAQAAVVAPVGEGICGLFLVAYVLLAKKSFVGALIGAFATWFSLAAAVVIANINSLLVSLALYLPLLLFAYYILEIRLKLESHGKLKVKYTKLKILGRALFAGGVVTFAVFMSAYGGPVLGGMFSVFPASFSSTIVITKKSGGVDFSRAITKPLVVSGLITVTIYAIAITVLYPAVGIWIGTIGSYLITMPFAYLTHLFIQKKLR